MSTIWSCDKCYWSCCSISDSERGQSSIFLLIGWEQLLLLQSSKRYAVPRCIWRLLLIFAGCLTFETQDYHWSRGSSKWWGKLCSIYAPQGMLNPAYDCYLHLLEGIVEFTLSKADSCMQAGCLPLFQSFQSKELQEAEIMSENKVSLSLPSTDLVCNFPLCFYRHGQRIDTRTQDRLLCKSFIYTTQLSSLKLRQQTHCAEDKRQGHLPCQIRIEVEHWLSLLLHSEFFQLALGGLAIGIGFGFCTSLSLLFMYNKKVLEMMLTVAATYGAYIVADEVAGASGVLAVVSLGKLYGNIAKDLVHNHYNMRLCRQLCWVVWQWGISSREDWVDFWTCHIHSNFTGMFITCQPLSEMSRFVSFHILMHYSVVQACGSPIRGYIMSAVQWKQNCMTFGESIHTKCFIKAKESVVVWEWDEKSLATFWPGLGFYT